MIFGCRYIDSNEEKFIKRLSEAVAIRSVSGCPEERGEVVKMVQYVAKVRYQCSFDILTFSTDEVISFMPNVIQVYAIIIFA